MILVTLSQIESFRMSEQRRGSNREDVIARSSVSVLSSINAQWLQDGHASDIYTVVSRKNSNDGNEKNIVEEERVFTVPRP